MRKISIHSSWRCVCIVILLFFFLRDLFIHWWLLRNLYYQLSRKEKGCDCEKNKNVRIKILTVFRRPWRARHLQRFQNYQPGDVQKIQAIPAWPIWLLSQKVTFLKIQTIPAWPIWHLSQKLTTKKREQIIFCSQ